MTEPAKCTECQSELTHDGWCKQDATHSVKAKTLEHYASLVNEPQPTLRDRFAMAALQVVFANPIPGSSLEDAVSLAFGVADLMLAARERK